MVAEAEEIGGRRRHGSRASELVRVLVVEEEDGGGPPGRLGCSWEGRRPRASRVSGGRCPAPRAVIGDAANAVVGARGSRSGCGAGAGVVGVGVAGEGWGIW